MDDEPPDAIARALDYETRGSSEGSALKIAAAAVAVLAFGGIGAVAVFWSQKNILATVVYTGIGSVPGPASGRDSQVFPPGASKDAAAWAHQAAEGWPAATITIERTDKPVTP